MFLLLNSLQKIFKSFFAVNFIEKKFENFLQSISLKKTFRNFSENPKKSFCQKKKGHRGRGGGKNAPFFPAKSDIKFGSNQKIVNSLIDRQTYFSWINIRKARFHFSTVKYKHFRLPYEKQGSYLLPGGLEKKRPQTNMFLYVETKQPKNFSPVTDRTNIEQSAKITRNFSPRYKQRMNARKNY